MTTFKTTTFKTSDAQCIQLARIVVAMSDAGLDVGFVRRAQDLAREDQGAYELLELWSEEEDDEREREEILADMQDMLDEADDLPARPLEKPYIGFDQLDDVAVRVRAHKEHLRQLIDAHGGVSEVARQAGMHQSALSRLLNSASMPRRSTLYRIANAMGVSESEVATDFVR